MKSANDSKRIARVAKNASAEYAELARWENEGGRAVREEPPSVPERNGQSWATSHAARTP